MIGSHTNSNSKSMTSVMEDYLEAIYELSQEKRIVRVKDIAGRLNVKMPTVTSMLKNLGGKGLIDYEKYGYVDLTDEGRKIGQEILRKHRVIYKFLTEILKVPARRASVEACQMEHSLSSSTLDVLIEFMKFIQICPHARDSWLTKCGQFCKIEEDLFSKNEDKAENKDED